MQRPGSTGRRTRQQRLPEHGSSRTASRSAPLTRRTPAERLASRHVVPGHELPAAQVTEIQRSRLLAGALAAVEEHGYEGTTVAHITARARISRRTFYELFADCEACLAALVLDVVGILEAELAQAGLEGLPWRERVRGGLRVMLSFFDREPALARLCMVQALRGGPQVLASRERTLARLAAILDEGRHEGARAGDCTPLTAEGLVGAIVGILHARLSGERPEPLVGLTSELTGMIVLPYLGPAAARRERTRAAVTAGAAAPPARRRPALSQGDPLQGLPMRLTYRTARVLGCIAARPGASNREVSGAAGVTDQGQISKLLARLERLGLLANTGAGAAKGEPNAWELTSLGERVAQRLRVSPEFEGGGHREPELQGRGAP